MLEEFLNKEVVVTIDRPMGTKHPNHEFYYPVNYGYIKGVMLGDGENLDAYVLGIFIPIKEFKGKVIAIIHRLNDNDNKLVVVSKGKQYTDEQIRAITEFQEKYFESEIIRKEK